MFRVAPEYFGFTFVLNGIGLVIFSQSAARWLKHRPGEPLFFAALASPMPSAGRAGAWYSALLAGAGYAGCCPGSSSIAP